MKRLIIPAVILAMFAFAWTPAFSQSSVGDDVYYSPKSAQSNTTTTTTPPAQTTTTAPTTQPSNTYQNSQQGYGSYSNRYQNSSPSYSTVDTSQRGQTIVNNYYGQSGMDGMYNPYCSGFGYDPYFASGFGLGFGMYDEFYPGFGLGLGFGYPFYNPFYNPFYPYYGYGFGYPYYGLGEGYGGFASYYGPRGVRIEGNRGFSPVESSSRGSVGTLAGAPREVNNNSAQVARTSTPSNSVRATNVPFSRPSGISAQSAARQGGASTRVATRNNVPGSSVHNYYGRAATAQRSSYAGNRGSITPRGGFSAYQNNRSMFNRSGAFGGRSSGSFGGYHSSPSFSGSSSRSFSGGGFSGGGRSSGGGGGGRR